MAEKKVLVNLNFNGNQIINVRAEVAASAPSTNLSAGRFYFNSQEQKLYVYTTSGWQVIGDNPSGMVTADNDLTADKVLVGDGSKKVKASSFTIASSVPANAVFTDKEVEQGLPTSGGEFPIFMSRSTWPLGTTTVTGSAFIKRNVTINGSTGVITAPGFHATTGITIGENNDEVATKDYVDTQDAKINDRISNISGFGRYLSGWDMATGEPTSLPTTPEYTLRSGDYFVISNIPSAGATKYKPNQTGTWQTDDPFAKTATNESCVVGGYWKYDGSTWTYFAPEQVVSLPSFTNTSKGAIKGSQSDGCVYHDSADAEGVGRVFGWDGKADNDNNHTITLQGDVTTVSGSHDNSNNSNVTISVTIANGAVTDVKIANGAVTTAKIANDAVDYTKIKAKATGVRINGVNGLAPCWQATGNGDEYKVTVSGVTRNGVVRLCERTLVDGGFNQAREVECLYEYGNDATGVHSCTIYINSTSAPTLGQYYLLCREE